MAPSSSTLESPNSQSPGRSSSAGGSSFLGRFSRNRPRTANSAVPTSTSTDSFGGGGGAAAAASLPTNSSTSSLQPTTTTATTTGVNFPTMDSTNQDNNPSRIRSSNRTSNFRPNTNNHPIPEQPSYNDSPPTSNNPIGRMFRRYSQGAGKNNSAGAEAAALAATAAASRGIGQSSTAQGSSSIALSTSPQRNARVSSEFPRTSTPQDSSRNRLSATPRPPPTNGASSFGGEAPSASRVQEPSTSAVPSTEAHAATSEPSREPLADTSSTTSAAAAAAISTSVHRIRLVPHLEAARSLHFEPVERDLTEGARPVKIGRFTDRTNPPPSTSAGLPSSNLPSSEGDPIPETTDHSTSSGAGTGAGSSVAGSNTLQSVPGSSAGGGGGIESLRVAFKSKVVSRGHAELWCEPGGKFFIRDTRSSSGTFLNHIRLSAPGLESRPFPLKDGDIIQLGVDYQGGTEEIYRCVKMRVELNRGWQRSANQFNVNAMRQLRALQGTPAPTVATTDKSSAVPTNRQSMSVTDCCICLFSVTVCQALFIAPCSHVFHYKCIRPLLDMHHPGFSCPLCRTFADLEADVEQDDVWQEALAKEEAAQRVASSTAALTPAPGDVVMDNPSAVAAANVDDPPSGDGQDVDMASSDQQAPHDVPNNVRSERVGASEATARGSVFQHSTPRDVLEDFEPTSELMDEGTDDREVMQVDAVESDRGAALGSHSSVPAPSTPTSSVPVMIARSGTSRSHDLRLDGLPSARWSPHSSSALFDDTEARTPQNQHFLATLAEAPPPPRSSLRGVGNAHAMGFVVDEMPQQQQQGGAEKAGGNQGRDRSITPVEAVFAGSGLPAGSASASTSAVAPMRRTSDSSGVEQVFGTAQPSPAMSRDISREAATAAELNKGKESANSSSARDADLAAASAGASGSRKRERAQDTSSSGDGEVEAVDTSPPTIQDSTTDAISASRDHQPKNSSSNVRRLVDAAGSETTAP